MDNGEIFSTPSLEESWNDFESRVKGRRQRRRAFAGSLMAIVIVAGIGLGMSLGNQETVLVAEAGKMLETTLPDGTSISLNSCSSISYSHKFGKKTRTVHLSGEAYFDVAHDAERPFIVETSRGNVTVHGTAFNVTDYASEDCVKVALERGSVSFEGVKLGVGEVLTASDEGISKTVEDVSLYRSWMERRLEMRSATLPALFARLSGIYGVNISCGSGLDAAEPFDVHLGIDESIEDILNAVSVMHPIEYQINGSEVSVRYSK